MEEQNNTTIKHLNNNKKRNTMLGLAAAIIAIPVWWIAWELGNISNKK